MERTNYLVEAPRGASMLIEIPVTQAGLGSIPLPVVQQLQNDTTQKIVVKALRLVTLDVLARGVTTGNVNAPLTELQKMSLILYSQGWEKGQYIPLLLLNDAATPAGTFPYRYHATKLADWTNVDWNKSKIVFSNGSVSVVAANYTIMLEVEYLRLDKNGEPMEGVV